MLTTFSTNCALNFDQAGRQASRQAGRQAGRQADRQAGRQAGRQTSWQAGRQADRWASSQAAGGLIGKQLIRPASVLSAQQQQQQQQQRDMFQICLRVCVGCFLTTGFTNFANGPVNKLCLRDSVAQSRGCLWYVSLSLLAICLNELSESGPIAALMGTPQKSLRMAGLNFHADQLGVSFS